MVTSMENTRMYDCLVESENSKTINKFDLIFRHNFFTTCFEEITSKIFNYNTLPIFKCWYYNIFILVIEQGNKFKEELIKIYFN